ncbi:DUF3977 family protein [Cytobacillus sp. IB215316]|uniref:DUF3977 family protein n=1 Tax=Cytobacillus sp. IB215316 TaxID=3097354 RepID=UPI002A15D94E|nr:DUF3977 family protein [Cytobacillus sp. IB215316]MDX8362744.1 DUF3977 family protein [Cytobacillus sp. IB215316]
MKYIEFGIGNKWLIRTETELSDGTEYEEKGIVGPIQFNSVYIRIWVRKTVYIIDTKQGFKKTKKNRNELKIIFGIVSL